MAQVIINGLSRIQANTIAMAFAAGDINSFLNDTQMKTGFETLPIVNFAVNNDRNDPTHEVNYTDEGKVGS